MVTEGAEIQRGDNVHFRSIQYHDVGLDQVKVVEMAVATLSPAERRAVVFDRQGLVVRVHLDPGRGDGGGAGKVFTQQRGVGRVGGSAVSVHPL